MDWLQVVIKEVVKNWMAIIIYFALGVVLIGIGWLPQKIGRNNDRKEADKRLRIQFQQQRQGFRQDLKEMLLENTKTVWGWREKEHWVSITPELEAKFVNIAESTAAAWFSGAVPPAGTIVTEYKPSDPGD